VSGDTVSGDTVSEHPGKVRIGLGLGARTPLAADAFAVIIDTAEDLGIDSVWFTERIGSASPDPLVAMAMCAGRTTRLKFGTSVMILPGRNPVVLAKALASLAVLSGGRLLPAFGLGAVDRREQQAFGVERSERASRFDEALEVMRSCWSGEPVTHHGRWFNLDDVTVQPVPDRIDVWLGGIAESELRRVARLADGWLPSFVTPTEARAGRQMIVEMATGHHRRIDEDHYGVLIPYAIDGPTEIAERIGAARRPDLADPDELIPTSWGALRDLIEAFIEIGTTKFVVLPVIEPTGVSLWRRHLGELSERLLDLET